jgi:hypothetical protein
MTTQFKEPLNLNEFRSVDGNILPDTDGSEWRISPVRSFDDLMEFGCIKLFNIRYQDS